MKVSVLMTCYNAASTIEESVRSVIAQTFTDWELVLVDNCSTDGSMNIVRSIADPRVKITQLARNHGRTPALNIGLGKARGEYLAILDADDISAPHRFALQVECLQANPRVVAVAS
ncbi:MAG: glycosyltransferase family 2 protein, partial [Actinomycetota bacterium]